MPSDRVIIIGAGINGLTAAAYLARRGLKPLVIERAERVGGCARTSEIAPGFFCPTLTHAAAIDPAIVHDLRLDLHGLHVIHPDAHLFAPAADGRALVLWADARRAASEIRGFSAADAERYPEFLASVARITRVLHGVSDSIPPDIDRTSASDLWTLLKSGRRFRALGRPDAYRLLRWMPMAVADLVAEWFESEPLRAAIAAGGVLGSFLGPRSAGTGAILLLLSSITRHPAAPGAFARGGPQAVADAVAAAAVASGAEIRTGADVARIEVHDESAIGVTLSTGERIDARAIVSAADVKTTMLGLIDPVCLAPDLALRVRNIRAHGTLAKVNFAVSALPALAAGRAVAEQQAALSGRIRLATSVDAIERAFDAAKYGTFADEPWIELTIPSIADPSLAPPGQHVVSAYVQFAPYHLRGTTWEAERERLRDVAVNLIERYAPGFRQSIVAAETITPVDLERRYGLSGGHIFHGELSLDQWYLARPLLGWPRYSTPIRSLFLCGSGTHPGFGGLAGRLAGRKLAIEN